MPISLEKRDQEAFRAAFLDDKKKGISEKRPYAPGFWEQVKVLTIRQPRARIQDRFRLYMHFSLATTLSLIVCVAYFDLPLIAAGGFTHGSVVFVAALVAIFDSFGEISLGILGRAVLNRQVSSRPAIPLFVILTDNQAGLQPRVQRGAALLDELHHVKPRPLPSFQLAFYRSARAFWIFHPISYLGYLPTQGFFRTFGFRLQNFDPPFRMSVSSFPIPSNTPGTSFPS
jgi:ATP-binding cassette subfamily G (WHITE) protein 2 (SNQ2)